MRMVSARYAGVLCGLAVVTLAGSAQAFTVSLKAVAKNGVALPGGPTNNITIAPDDQITTEIHVRGWATDFPIKDYTFAVDNGLAAATGGTNGKVYPVGWEAPINPETCEWPPGLGCTTQNHPPSCDVECLPYPRYPICDVSGNCTRSGHNPDSGSFIQSSHVTPPFIFSGITILSVVDNSQLVYRFNSQISDGSPGVSDPGSPRYAGTLLLRARPNACGTFTFNFDPGETYVADANNKRNTIPETREPLVVNVTPCARYMLSCDPPHNWLDARFPTNRTNIGRVGQFFIDATFTGPTAGMTPADFTLTEVGTIPATPNSIATVVPSLVNPNLVRVNFFRRIGEKVWTCILDELGDRQCCIGALPGDVNGGCFTNSFDTFALKDNLDGFTQPRLPPHKCDIDRSGGPCLPQDILAEIDLLNGCEAFDPWNGAAMQCVPPGEIPP